MTTLDLETAVSQLVDGARGAAGTPPWFLMTGAGVSSPHVPLAYQIIEHCKVAATKRDAMLEEPAAEDRYAYWLGKAYPRPEDRQRYFQEAIERARISHANFRLAHLLESGALGRLLLTTNFDDLVSRALRLLGHSHITCDHPATLPRIQPDRSDIQIVHVHGSYWFYDACNLKSEIARRTDEVGAFVTRLCLDRSPVIFGYSGQEPGDAFMTALQHLLPRRVMRAPVYWFCYRSSEPERIARALGTDENVRFVVPPDRASTLDATTALDALLRGFRVGRPALVANPLGFLSSSLASELPEWRLGGSDVYQDELAVVVDRLREASTRETLDRGEIGELLAAIRTAHAEGDLAQAVALARRVPERPMDGVLRTEVLLALTRLGLDDACSDALALLESAVGIAIAEGARFDRTIMGLVALAVSRRAQLIDESGDRERARAAWDLAIAVCANVADPFVRECWFRNRIERALLIRDDAELERVIGEMAGETDVELVAHRARARLLLALHRDEKGVFDDIIRDLERTESSAMHRYLSIARTLHAYELEGRGLIDDAIDVATRVAEAPVAGCAVDASSFENAVELLARSLSARLTGLDELSPDERLARMTEILQRFGHITAQAFQFVLVASRYYTAVALADLGRRDEARRFIEQTRTGLKAAPDELREGLTAELDDLAARISGP